MKRLQGIINNITKKSKINTKTIISVFMMLLMTATFGIINTNTAEAKQYKTKSFYLYDLGDNTSVSIKAIRDRDGATVWGWENTGAGGSISVYNLGGGTWWVNMQGANVTSWTPYCYVNTTKSGWKPNGWSLGPLGGHGTAGYNGNEVHREGDYYWTGNSCSFYIGAGFMRESVTAQWERIYTNWLYIDLQGGELINFTPQNYAYEGNGKYRTTDSLIPNTSNFVTIRTPHRYGYKFLGYYDSKEGGNKIYEETDGFSCTAIDGTEYWKNNQFQKNYSISVYAHWEKLSYDIDYDLQGGTMTESSDKYDNLICQITSANNKNYGISFDTSNDLWYSTYSRCTTMRDQGGSTWQLLAAGDVKQPKNSKFYGYYYIRNAITGNYLTYNGTPSCYPDAKSYVYQTMQSNGTNDRTVWALKEHSDGSISFMPKKDLSLAINDYYNDTSNNARIVLHNHSSDYESAARWYLKTIRKGRNPGESYWTNYRNTTQETSTLGENFKLENPTKENYVFLGWKITGINDDLRTYAKVIGQNDTINDNVHEWNDMGHNDEISNLKIINGTDGFTVYIKVVGDSANYDTYMPTWTPYNGQDDIGWATMEKGTFKYGGVTFNRRSFVSYSAHKNETDSYKMDFYTKNSNGSTQHYFGGIHDYYPNNTAGAPYSQGIPTSGKMLDEHVIDTPVNCNGRILKNAVVRNYQNYIDVYANFEGLSDSTVRCVTWPSDFGQGNLREIYMENTSTYTVNGQTYNYHARVYYDTFWNLKQDYTIHFYMGAGGINWDSQGIAGYRFKMSTDTRPGETLVNSDNFYAGGSYFDTGDLKSESDGTYSITTRSSNTDVLTEVNGLRNTSGNVKFTAMWAPLHYTVNYDGNDETSGTMDPQIMTRDVTTALNKNKFVKKGYKFIGWSKFRNPALMIDNSNENQNNQILNNQNIKLESQKLVVFGNTLDAKGKSIVTVSGDKVSATSIGNMIGYSINVISPSGNTKQYTSSYSTNKIEVPLTDFNNEKGVYKITYYAIFRDTFAARIPICVYQVNFDTTKAKENEEYYVKDYAAGNGKYYFKDEEPVTNLAGDVDDHVTLYAQWEKCSYTVRYHANGGSGTMEDQHFDYDEQKRLTKNAFSPPSGVYKFAEWNTKPDGTGKSYSDEQAVQNLTDVNGGVVTLYARWKTDTDKFKLIYDANGGEGNMPSEIWNFGKLNTLKVNRFTYKGHQFLKWNTEPDGSGTSYGDGEQIVINQNNDKLFYSLTLYAQWQTDKYTVRYHANGGDGSMSNQTFKYHEEKALHKNEFTMSHGTFVCWNTKPDGSGISYKDEQVVRDLTTVNGAYYDLYAIWNKDLYKVIYNSNESGNGEGNELSQFFEYDKETKLDKNTFTNGSKVFKEWNTKADGTGDSFSDEQKVINLIDIYKDEDPDITSMKLYAQWVDAKEYYTVKYNKNASDATGTMEDQIYEIGVPNNLTKNQFKRKGYRFVGWATSSTGTSKYEDGAWIAKDLTSAGGTITLYAKWEADEYTIVYDGNGATSGSTASQLAKRDEEKTIKSNGYIKEGNSFICWNTQKDGSGTNYSPGQKVKNLTKEKNGTVTLYAQWHQFSYTVKFFGSGASGYMEPQTFKFGEEKALSLNKFVNGNKQFKGWSTTENGSVKYVDGQKVKNLTSEDGGVVNLYAVFEEKLYTVKFNANGGKGTMANQTFEKDEAKKLTKSSFKKAGYSFAGWSKSSTSNTIVYKDEETVKNIANPGETIELFAVYTNKSYTVIYDGNGATSGSTANSTHYYDKAKNLTANGYKRTGYNFKGWTTTPKGKKVYEDKQSVTNLLTAEQIENGTVSYKLYAYWEPINYQVSYDPSGATSGTMSNSDHVYDKAKNLNANTYKRTGYTFKNWYLATNTSKTFEDEESVKNLTTVDGDIVKLKVNWLANTYYVVYHGNGSDGGSMQTSTHTYDVAKNLNANQYTREGYNFVGWSTSANGSVKYQDGQSVKNLTATNYGTVDLYAVWETKTYKNTVKHYAYGFKNKEGNNTSKDAYLIGTTNKSVKYGENFTFNMNNKVSIPNGFYVERYFYTNEYSKTGHMESYAFDENVKQLSRDMNFEMHYTPYTYKITYNLGGGTNNANNPTSYNVLYGVTLNNATRTGYKFDGWYDDNGNKVTGINKGCNANFKSSSDLYAQLETRTTGNINLTAHWVAKSYTIVYHGNGNTGGSTASSTHKYDEEKALTANGFTKTGYKFKNWSRNEDGTGKTYEDKEIVKNLTEKDGDTIDLYAQWTPIEYTIKYTFGTDTDVSGTMGTSSHVYDQEKSLNPNQFSKKGYTFKNWILAKDKTKTFADKERVLNLTTKDKDVVELIANFKANEYTIKYDGNGATSGSTTSSSHTYDVAKKLTANGYKRTGYVFLGWSTDKNAKTPTYKDNQSVTNLTAANNSTVTLYAIWRPINYEIHYNAPKGSTTLMPNSKHVYDVEKPLSRNIYTKEGYNTFVGWSANADGSGKLYKDQEVVVNLTTKDNDVIELYPVLKANVYYVSFDSNNANGTMKKQTFTYDKEQALNKNEFTKPGYKFNGWNTKVDGSGDAYDNEEVVKNLTKVNGQTITLYAQWKLNVVVKITVDNEYYHVDDIVTPNDIRKTLTAIILDKSTGNDITSSFNNAIVSKVITKEITNEKGIKQNVAENLNTSKEDHFKAIYELTIVDEYNPKNSETSTAKQKITVVKDTEDKEQQIPSVPPTTPDDSINKDTSIRYISKKYLNTLDGNSKWKTDAGLNAELTYSLNKKATDENSIYVIEMSKEDCKQIKKYVCDGKTWNKDLNKNVLSKFSHIIKKKP